MFKQEGLFIDSDSKPAFFLSVKSQEEIDGLQINYHLLQAFLHFNASIKPDFVLPLPIPNMRNYFLKRVQLSNNIEQAYYGLQALA